VCEGGAGGSAEMKAVLEAPHQQQRHQEVNSPPSRLFTGVGLSLGVRLALLSIASCMAHHGGSAEAIQCCKQIARGARPHFLNIPAGVSTMSSYVSGSPW
jgi:hypothetical protein